VRNIERLLFALLIAAFVAWLAVEARAHDPKRKIRKPTKAAPKLKEARARMDAAKKQLAAQGKYTCCIKPTCDLCARTAGKCECARHVAAGHGACGECLEGWQAGLGAVKNVEAKTVKLLPHAARSVEDQLARVTEIALGRPALNDAKRTLVGEGRYACCARGGCDSCAHAGECPCGARLANAPPSGKPTERGVCGECLDEWHAGHGAFNGIALDEVTLAPMNDDAAMSQQASGTSWQPESSPLSAWRTRPGDWQVMLHGNLFMGFNHQAYPRGVGKAESQNWLMLMGERQAGRGRLQLRGMFSAEALTAPHGGFPQLFQTGETYRGRPIIDAQHPHDAVMELAARYTLPLGESAALEFYGGPVGEPALGPVAFMHRASASENPAAPLAHHTQDSTHITHGVATLALQIRRFKFEVSGFRGREPNEDRLRVELGKFDSYSARAWFAPTPNWAMQFSYGRLQNPENAHPGELTRYTASVAYNRAFTNGNWASTIIWGRNYEYDPTFGEFYKSNAYLVESTLKLRARNHLYTRLEWLDKQGLLTLNIFERCGFAVDPSLPGRRCSPNNLAAEDTRATRRAVPLHPDPFGFDLALFSIWRRVGAFTFGGVRDIYDGRGLRLGVGADATFYYKPALISTLYGQQPVSYRLFLRLRPQRGE